MKSLKNPFSKPYPFDTSLKLDTYTALCDNIVSISPAPICDFVPSIDRIQIVFLKDSDSYDYLKETLSSEFKSLKPFKKKGRFIRPYYTGDSFIELMSGVHHRNWLILYRPSPSLQIFIQSMITPLMGLNVDSYTFINLQQVEFAYDFFPCEEKDVDDIFAAVARRIALRYARSGACKWRWRTYYIGLRGDIRRNSGGLRMYAKEESEQNFFEQESVEKFLRLEIQLNNPGLKRRNINLESLPLLPNMIDPMKILSFREPLTKSQLDMLVDARYGKLYPKEIYKHSPSMEKRMKSILMRRSLGSLFEGEISRWHLARLSMLDETSMTVAEQIDWYKKIKKEKRLSYDHTKVFPKIELQPPV